MVENSIFSQEVIDFILENENVDPYALALKKSPFPDVGMKIIAQQIQGRKIAKRKFPFLLNEVQYRYPKKESLEQASSEQTALFKSKLISGKSFIDLTGGMGIDTYLLGKQFESCVYVEPNQVLYDTTIQNFKILKFDKCLNFNSTCEEFLKNNSEKFDWVYIDPSRRLGGQRKISVHNYQPNIVELQDVLADTAKNIMVKLSPMQDISECVNVLEDVHKVWVISYQNEVKELLLHIIPYIKTTVTIAAIDLDKGKEMMFSAHFEEKSCSINLSRLQNYIYQPNSAIIKAQLQNKYAKELGLEKLHQNTQLFTSDNLIKDFKGKIFAVKKTISLNKRDLKNALPQMKANVISKNFPLKPQELIQKYKLKEGGNKFLIAFTDIDNNKRIAICELYTT